MLKRRKSRDVSEPIDQSKDGLHVLGNDGDVGKDGRIGTEADFGVISEAGGDTGNGGTTATPAATGGLLGNMSPMRKQESRTRTIADRPRRRDYSR